MSNTSGLSNKLMHSFHFVAMVMIRSDYFIFAGCTPLRDIVLLINNYGRTERFPQVIDFLVKFVRTFQTGKDFTRFAAYTYNEMAHEIFNLKR